MEKAGPLLELSQIIEPYVENADGIRVISLQDLDTVAERHTLSRRDAEMAALELGILPRRYLRNYGTIGLDGQLALLRSSVAVIGLGGLGGYVVEGLSRVGVGRLTLVDGDVFFDHNLNRQVLSSEADLGRTKAQLAGRRVQQINGAVQVHVYTQFATRENLGDLLTGLDVVVDALDRLPTRIVLQEAACRAGVPMVHGAIAGWMGQVMTIYPGDAGLRALYGDGPVPEQGAEAELGCPPASPMMVAAWQVHETVKILLGRGEVLRGRMLFIDASISETRVLDLT
jgi:molybdopterin/thiamine biosynthesis adenylyltransferase